jgi:tight adherence protein B
LTAQTQLSKRILMVLPFVLLGGLTMLNADYMSPLFTTQVGRYLLVVALMGILIGMWVMNKLSTLQY